MDTSNTAILIISDTHGEQLKYVPSEPVDVVIHCGDITDGSQLHEYRATLDMLQSISAGLKLVIAGNHDWTIDQTAYDQMLKDVCRSGQATIAEFEAAYGLFDNISEAQGLFETADAVAAGIVFLHEGTQSFNPANGARLKVHASPFTPMENGNMGFQYELKDPHAWQFCPSDQIDVLITHGPPRGVLDMVGGERIWCPELFAAVARSRPLMHCFGHAHAGWGAKLVTWRGRPSQRPTHFTDIDNNGIRIITSLASLRDGKFDSADIKDEEARTRLILEDRRHARADETIANGSQTLVVNAAIKDTPGQPQHLPWIVALDLPIS